MPIITEIRYMADRQKYWIFVDSEFCCSVRERTFPAMGLQVGSSISCDELKRQESFHWKRAYGTDSWDKEKVRLERVKSLIEEVSPELEARIVGFGADTSELIEEHPEESGKPDMDVTLKANSQALLLSVEVTGTEFMRPGTDTYWVRPDKLEYARNHPEQDVWIILHYAQPTERIACIKPDPTRDYPVSGKVIRGSIEHYVEFSDQSLDVYSLAAFAQYLREKLHRTASSKDNLRTS